jgi:hypothetical protein
LTKGHFFDINVDPAMVVGGLGKTNPNRAWNTGGNMTTRLITDQLVSNSEELTDLRRKIGMVVGILTDHLTVDDINEWLKYARIEAGLAASLKWYGRDSHNRQIQWSIGIPVYRGQYSNRGGDIQITCHCGATPLYSITGRIKKDRILGDKIDIALDAHDIRRVWSALEILTNGMLQTFPILSQRLGYLLDDPVAD